MKRKILLMLLLSSFTIGLTNCSDDDGATPIPAPTPIPQPIPQPPILVDTTNSDTTNIDTTNKTQILAKNWIVDEAFVNGSTPDASSKGLILHVRADGSYTLVNTRFIGTWEFESNGTKINWDKGTSFNQVFTLLEFTDTKINATFISAFTGENARWVMIPE